jgi:hypothetical protein
MPIKQENKARYPKNWPEISRRIRHLAGNKCQFCGLGNGWIGCRDDSGEFFLIAKAGRPQDFAGHATGYKVFKVVLTVAHLDHTPENCSDDNLKALCQRCHLNYDKKHHAETAYETKRLRLNIKDLFV